MQVSMPHPQKLANFKRQTFFLGAFTRLCVYINAFKQATSLLFYELLLLNYQQQAEKLLIAHVMMM